MDDYNEDHGSAKELWYVVKHIEGRWLVHMGVADRLILKSLYDDEVRKCSLCPELREEQRVHEVAGCWARDRYLALFRDSIPKRRVAKIGGAIPKRAYPLIT